MWSPEKNIKWSVALPERGNSSPIVWEDRVYLSQAIESEHFRSLMCFDRASGDLMWQSGVRYARAESKHETNTYCASSPVTDGERIYVSYASAGLYCYDMDGNELWHRNLGPHQHQWGDGASPILEGRFCFFYHGPGPGSYLIALDKRTGDTVWRVEQSAVKAGPEREDGFNGNGNGMVGTFATPMVIDGGRRRELIDHGTVFLEEPGNRWSAARSPHRLSRWPEAREGKREEDDHRHQRRVERGDRTSSKLLTLR